MSILTRLHIDIDDRVQSILINRADWQCKKGCDGCCQQLARVPQLTIAEWNLLKKGLAGLTPEQLQPIRIRMTSLTATRPVTCPLLDLTTGACPVYAQRPVACRTYGFYVQRNLGLYCPDIETRVAAGELADVVWGNHDAIDQRLATLGESRALSDWFAEWIAENNQ
jgi:Fe-S-cluster containining protein